MKLRAGIIGLGVGEAHIAAYNAHPQCKVEAICDLSETKLSQMRQKYGIAKATQDADAILSDPEIEIVSIASYDNDHYAQIVKAIQKGKHVFVEKPFCLYAKEARHIRELWKASPEIKISSNLVLRKSPRFLRLKNMVATGLFGDLFYVEGDYHYGRLHKITEGWRGQMDFYSVVYGGGVHMIDLLLWLTGDSILEVTAYGNRIASHGSAFRYNDCVVAILKFQSGIIGKMTVDFGGVQSHFHGLSLHGTKATFVNNLPHGKLFVSRDSNVPAQEVTDTYPGVLKGDLIDSFVNSIIHDSPAVVSTEDAFRAMSVCFAIEESVQNRQSIKVQYI